jgi:hypothetical protein
VSASRSKHCILEYSKYFLQYSNAIPNLHTNKSLLYLGVQRRDPVLLACNTQPRDSDPSHGSYRRESQHRCDQPRSHPRYSCCPVACQEDPQPLLLIDGFIRCLPDRDGYIFIYCLTILQVTTNRLHYSSTPSTQTNLLQARRMGSRMGAQSRVLGSNY